MVSMLSRGVMEVGEGHRLMNSILFTKPIKQLFITILVLATEQS